MKSEKKLKRKRAESEEASNSLGESTNKKQKRINVDSEEALASPVQCQKKKPEQEILDGEGYEALESKKKKTKKIKDKTIVSGSQDESIVSEGEEVVVSIKKKNKHHITPSEGIETAHSELKTENNDKSDVSGVEETLQSKKKMKKKKKQHSDKTEETEGSVGEKGSKQNLKASKSASGKGSQKKNSKSKGFVLFVGQIPHHVSQKDVERHFNKEGGIKEVRLLKYPDSGRSRGCAYVEFVDNNHRQTGRKLHESLLGGAKIRVEYPYQGNKKHGAGKPGQPFKKNSKPKKSF